MRASVILLCKTCESMETPSTLEAITRLRSRYISLLTRPAIMERFAQICRERSDVEAIRCIFNNQAHEWIHSVGVCGDEQLAKLVPPLPPRELRQIVAAPEPEIFLWTGLIDIAGFLAIYHHHNPSVARPRVLDFGAGCGRMIRFLSDHTDKYEPFASDVNAQHMTWCQENLAGVRSFKNEALPPLAAEAGAFDLVYSLSVFTHLSEPAANAWMQEMQRILAPGGIVIFTTHGRRALETIRDSTVHQQMFLTTPEEASAMMENLPRLGFIFLKYPSSTLDAAGTGSEYGNSFIHADYVRSRWQENFEQLDYIPAGLRGWQDVVVMRRK
jgi:SAM-dependent methyltransferase